MILYKNSYLRFSFFTIFIFSVMVCCNTKDREIKYITLSPAIINNEGLYTNFPGNMLADDQYLYIEYPRSRDTSLGIHDIHTGEMLARTIPIGNGPGEFVTPRLLQIVSNEIYITDLNGSKDGFISVEKALNGQYSFREASINRKDRILKALIINDSTKVIHNPQPATMFEMCRSGKTDHFGEPFVLDLNEANRRRYYQGTMAYHEKKKVLVYSNFYLPYISIYKYNNDIFDLAAEFKGFDKVKVKNGKPDIDNSRKGISGLTLSKDYIVCLQRDYERNSVDETTVGMDLSKVPSTVFLYSFRNAKLMKKIDLSCPVIRIACSGNNNTLYAIVLLDNKLKVVKYDLSLI